ncbi:MAG: hypothetical protein FIA95_09655, partial [Gemmatimonadetes bacterium]|nr:hypothetical protein [Gemmatimonadota bacterium]
MRRAPLQAAALGLALAAALAACSLAVPAAAQSPRRAPAASAPSAPAGSLPKILNEGEYGRRQRISAPALSADGTWMGSAYE